MAPQPHRPFRAWKRSAIHSAARSLASVFPPYEKSTAWIERSLKYLQRSKRFEPGSVVLGGRVFHYPDAVAFAFAWEQIFLNECYRFTPNNESPRIIDCGANIGLASIYWKLLYPSANVTAVEADNAVFAYMIKNLSALGIDDVECLNKAVWHKGGEVGFSSQGADRGGVANGSDNSVSGTLRVEALPLPDLLGSGPVELLKIDVEGAECELLIGHHEWLAEVRRIFVEFHSYPERDQRLDEILASLRAAGFRVHLQPELVSPFPFVDVRVDEGMDQRINIYGWRP